VAFILLPLLFLEEWVIGCINNNLSKKEEAIYGRGKTGGLDHDPGYNRESSTIGFIRVWCDDSAFESC
jgi:hypothetical protein